MMRCKGRSNELEVDVRTAQLKIQICVEFENQGDATILKCGGRRDGWRSCFRNFRRRTVSSVETYLYFQRAASRPPPSPPPPRLADVHPHARGPPATRPTRPRRLFTTHQSRDRRASSPPETRPFIASRSINFTGFSAV